MIVQLSIIAIQFVTLNIYIFFLFYLFIIYYLLFFSTFIIFPASVLDTAWRSDLLVTSFLEEWGQSRCGGDGENADISKAYRLLAETVYAPGQEHTLHHFYCTEMMPLIQERPLWTGGFNTSLLLDAWGHLLRAASSCHARPVYFDLVDVAREYLALGPALCAYDCMMQAYNANSSLGVWENGQRLLAVMDHLDELLNTEPGLMLGTWVHEAYDLGNELFAPDLLVWNALSQITLWYAYPADQPPSTIPVRSDYAVKMWGGLTKMYHASRLRLFVETATYALEHQQPVNTTQLTNDYLDLAVAFQNTKFEHHLFPNTPQGDSLEVAERLYAIYAADEQCVCR
eukprot:m.231273 g.231273  ORF g.231273 m.231273 type:complete len:342 (+) comp17064_c6_seq1:3607-4632(+)